MSGDVAREEFLVPRELAGQRLDRVLATLLDGLPRARVRELLEDRHVWVDGEPVTKSSRPAAAGETIAVQRVLRDRTRPGRRSGLELRIVYEDDSFCVIDKPAGMVAHPSSTVRGGTVAELAVARYGELPDFQGEGRPGIVHRLDAETSGLMLIARTQAAGTELLRQFQAREVKKTYLALVHHAPRFDSDWIEGCIGRSSRSTDRMAVVPAGEGREAATFYETLERFDGFGYVAAKPVTGRTHQIRVHLASIKHHLVGDSLYRSRDTPALPKGAPGLDRHALHAHALEFTHPASGEPLRFELPLPPDMERFLEWLRKERSL